MLKLRVLTTVSAFALATAAGMSGAKANNLILDLTGPSQTITAGSSADIQNVVQINSLGEFTGDVSDVVIGFPTGRGDSHDLGGGTNTIVDSENEIFAIATGNTAITNMDFYVATNGGIPGSNGASTLGSFQLNSDSSDIVADVELGDIQVDVIDLGVGSSVEVDSNAITADGKGNNANSSITGNVNNLQNSTELGQATISSGTPVVTAGATALVGSAQFNFGAPAMDATVSDSRIGLLARVDAEPAIVGVPLDLTNNTIAATFIGNNAVSGVALGNDGAVTLVGTVGTVNVQGNDGDFSIDALVQDVVIEAGDTQNYVGTEYIADLVGSTLTFEGNEILATAASNRATNSVSLDEGLNQDGVAGPGDQLNSIEFLGVDTAEVVGDLFIANAQFSAVSVNADIDVGDMNVLVEDVLGSEIIVDGNTISATASGSSVTNMIDVGGSATFDSLVAINSLQYTEGTQTASNDSVVTVDVASSAGAGDVTTTSISVDENTLSSEATGNIHSSSLELNGTTVSGVGGQTGNSVESDRDLESGYANADFSILTAQVLDGGSAVADVLTTIDVDVADLNFTVAALSVSNNDILARAIGNLSTEASIAVDATSVNATIALANVQTVEDDTLLSSSIAPNGNGAFITVDVGAGNGVDAVTVTQAAINVDDNTFDSRVWGNLADSTTNSISVTGVTVGDDDQQFSELFVDRASNPVTDLFANGGFVLVNDQSVEDLNASVVTASATGDLINLTVGSNLDPAEDSSVTNSNITANSNSATTSATLNQSTSEVLVDAVTLNASSVLLNVQTVADQDGVLGSAQIAVDQNDLDITIDVIAGDEEIEDVTVQANDNSMLASARLNLATNTVDVTAQSQTVDSVFWSGGVGQPDRQTSISLGQDVAFARSENLLVNDQNYSDLGVDGVSVNITDNDITIDLAIEDDDLINSVIQADDNAINAVAAGNDATNVMKLAIQTYDLSGVDSDGNQPGNGPIAALVNNQGGASEAQGLSGGISTSITGTTIAIDANGGDLNGDVTDDVVGSDLSADSNTVRALSRANNVSNALTATGTTIESATPESPLASVFDNGNLTTFQTQFAVASRQINSVDIASEVLGTAISVEAGSIFGPSEIEGVIDSNITANSNLVVSEARGSDASSALTLVFTQNEGQGFVTNLQYADADVSYSAATNGTEISVLTDVSDSVNGSAFATSGNAVAALASANRATNIINTAMGSGDTYQSSTNVILRNSNNVVEYDPLALNGQDVTAESALAIVNVQGDPGDVFAEIDVSAEVIGTLIGVISEGLFDSGSVAADSNLILAQAAQHTATNTLTLTASANIAADAAGNSTPGASVFSLQTITDGSETTATVALAGIVAFVDDPRSTDSFSASASSNQVIASAIGGTASNALRATAGAEINAGAGSSTPTIGDVTTLDAGFNVLNIQQGEGALFGAAVQGVAIAAGAAEDYSSDSVEVNDNLVRAEARGFLSTNILVLDAGSSSNAMAAVANSQTLESSLVDAIIGGVAIATGNLDEGAEDSALTVGGNTVEAIATANRSVNALQSTAAATLQESSGAGSIIDPTGSTRIIVTGSDYAVLNDQSTADVEVNATIAAVAIGIDGLNETLGVDRSALSVEGNEVQATAIGNDTVNSLVLNTGTFQHPSASISNVQTNVGSSMTASVDGVIIGIGAIETLGSNSSSSNSSFTVRGNSVGATAIGNSASNVLRSGN